MPSPPTPALETQHLRLLLVLGTSGTVTRAATELHLSQSAVSRQLAELEQRLGVPLYERGRRGLIATSAGARLVAESAELFEHLRRVERSVTEHIEPPARVRIATECFTCYHWLPPLLTELRVARPGVSVEIVLEATRAPLEYLRRGAIDIAIAASTSKDRKLVALPLFEDELVAIARPDHRLSRRRHLNAAHFADDTLYVHEGQSRDLKRFEQTYFAKHRPGCVERVPLTEALVGFVSAGFGLGIVARWAVERELRESTLIALPLSARGLTRKWSAVTLSGRTIRPVQDVLRCLGRALTG